MRQLALNISLMVALVPVSACAQDMSPEEIIRSAVSAGPASISDEAAVLDWNMNEVRAGTNGWTCLPDFPDTSGNDPMCLDEPWLNWLDAYVNQTEPDVGRMGFGYMLRGGSPESNVDPYAEGPTADNEWIEEGTPHVMIVVPASDWLQGVATDPSQGGPWVMWRGTSYVHIHGADAHSLTSWKASTSHERDCCLSR